MSLNREQIEQCIPHRAPFLWLDEIVEITSVRLTARKFLDPQLDVFAGHYPDFPVLPGVLQCEMAFQAAAVFIAKTESMVEGQIPVVTRLNNTKFRHMIGPGEMVDIEVELTDRLANAFFLAGKISAGGRTATRLEFACAITAAGSSRSSNGDGTARS
jgi:3-hydroxyacyl-[acyl-carrier-protein] dehydratase